MHRCNFGTIFDFPGVPKSAPGRGLRAPRRGRVGVRKLGLHITFALHLCTCSFLSFWWVRCWVRSCKYLTRQSQGCRFSIKNCTWNAQKSPKFSHRFLDVFLSDFKWILSSFLDPFSMNFPTFILSIFEWFVRSSFNQFLLKFRPAKPWCLRHVSSENVIFRISPLCT